MKWEYKTEKFKWDESSEVFRVDEVGSGEFLAGTLARLGQDQWELVSFATPGSAATGIAVLKRPVLDPGIPAPALRPLDIKAG